MKHSLGDFSGKIETFSGLDAVFREFETKEFQALPDRRRSEWVNRVLLDLIQKEEEPCFLLPAVLSFIERIDQQKCLLHYTFTSFELWLNHVSNLSPEENYAVRAKIAGKRLDRSGYQLFFPIGTGKMYEGTHFVTAHRSPDLDTTIASFWGWLDAFAARVGTGLHIWNLPGGPPGSQIEIDLLFRAFFGPAVFTHLPKTRNALTLTGNDLMTQKGFQRKFPEEPLSAVDHERDAQSVVVVDPDGFYLGDWRTTDVEGVRQLLILLGSSLRWFENNLQLGLIALFAKSDATKTDIQQFLECSFQTTISQSEPAKEFTAKQTLEVGRFITSILKIKEGLDCSFERFWSALAALEKTEFKGPGALLSDMSEARLFDQAGRLIEERTQIFHYLLSMVSELHDSIVRIRSRMERLEVALAVKNVIFNHTPTYITVRTDIEEIRNKMGSYSYLTVVYPDRDRQYPVGVIHASDVRKQMLGTVSLRDFCNREEMGIPSYLEVISVIDHHKTTLQTSVPPSAILSDAQSSNTLLASLAMQINDRTSLGGMTLQEIEQEIDSLNLKESSGSEIRILQRLLQRRLIAEAETSFYVHPARERLEYLHFLYGILDDTDLLSKMTHFDVEIVLSLLNRLKSLSLKKEVEIVHFDDIPRDKNFVKAASRRLLQHPELYSLYKKVYEFREQEVERNLALAAAKQPSNLFADTKEQNGCCRIGQTKVFAANIPLYEAKAGQIRAYWVEIAQKVHREHPEIDLHLHMISTIVGAEEVYKGGNGAYSHQDELWLWCSPEESAVEHLKNFLSSFQNSPALKNNPMEMEFLGPNGQELMQIVSESFLDIPRKLAKKPDAAQPIAVLRFKPGTLNSRKAMVSPFLPVLPSNG